MGASREIRIGIDVGGTFTDAVAIDAHTFDIVSKIKIPTTHTAKEGVAKGVIDSIREIIKVGEIDPSEVVFIAHGTTQATNALLEGDVANVGIIGMGAGIEGVKSKSDTNLTDIPISEGKSIKTVQEFIDTSDSLEENQVKAALSLLKERGAQVIVASEAFSVDRPENEQFVQSCANQEGLLATGGHEISKLYGLKARTRTAVINASILPKMMNTANMTQHAVDESGICSPLMIMRCDGGVMKVEEIKSRPILTILSGPAAGVAGALMYERVSDGIFLEVGGTSTDISAIRNGKVMVNYAEVGGHKTYVTSLDVRTIGIGGGSMIRVGKDKIKDVGPRSAHIANCGYCVFADKDVIENGTLKMIAPLENDAEEFAVIEGSDGKNYAITLSCAANLSGFVGEGDYARGNLEAARCGLQKLAAYMGTSVENVCGQIMQIVNEKAGTVIRQLMKDYDLNQNMAVLAGGGGGASTVIWSVAQHMGMEARLARNAPIISTIGAALAMVREVVERTLINPNENELLRIRQEAEHLAIESGANPATVEVSIEIDATLNRVRAIAVGTVELVRKQLDQSDLEEPEIRELAAQAMGLENNADIQLIANNQSSYVYQGIEKRKKFMIFSSTIEHSCVVDRKGVVRLRLEGARTAVLTARRIMESGDEILRKYAVYDESGERAPDIFLLVRAKVVEFRGIPTMEQLNSLVRAEANAVDPEETMILFAKERR